MNARQKYVAKVTPDRALPDLDAEQIVVVIPARREGDLTDILESVQRALPSAWTIVVVNDDDSRLKTNQETAQSCQKFERTTAIDRFTSPFRGGVGAARKIGMDNALWITRNACDAWIVSLDADTLILGDYESALANARSEAVLCRYRHPLTNQAIIRYEIWMRLFELGLNYARSPFAFTALGSRFAVRASAYCAVAGMPQRQAGEDFHFLNKLVKTFGAAALERTQVIVEPSARESTRVPFGTGPAVAANAAEHSDMPSFQIFEELRAAYEFVQREQRIPPDSPFSQFAHQQRQCDVVSQLRNKPDFERRFFQWWDGISEIRFVHWRERDLGRSSFRKFTERLLGRSLEDELELVTFLRSFNGTLAT